MADAKANIHLIVGVDDYLVETTARKIINAAVPADLRATAVEIVSGEAAEQNGQLSSISACQASIATPPFLDPVKVTWWRNVTFFMAGKKEVADIVKAALEKFAKGLVAQTLPPNQHLVITAPNLLMTSIVAKTLKTCAEVITFSVGKNVKDRKAVALMNLPALAKDEGITFAPGADESFIAKVGEDTRTIISELAKLHTYIGAEKRPVTEADIAAISSPGGEEPEFYNLTEAIGKRNTAAVANFIRKYASEKIGIVLATVAEKYFRDLMLYRDAMDRGWMTIHGWARNLPEEIINNLDSAGIGPNVEKRGFLRSKNMEAAQNYTPYELRVARYRMYTLREKYVSSSAVDDATLLTELLRIVTRPPARRVTR